MANQLFCGFYRDYIFIVKYCILIVVLTVINMQP